MIKLGDNVNIGQKNQLVYKNIGKVLDIKYNKKGIVTSYIVDKGNKISEIWAVNIQELKNENSKKSN